MVTREPAAAGGGEGRREGGSMSGGEHVGRGPVKAAGGVNCSCYINREVRSETQKRL